MSRPKPDLRLVEPLPDIAGALPPHNLEAEAAVLGAAMLSRAVYESAAEIARAEHFHDPDHARIWEAIEAVAKAGPTVDTVMVGNYLRDRGWLQRMGGSPRLAEMADTSPNIRNVRDHAIIVRNLWALRRVIAECDRIRCSGYFNVGEVRAFLEGAERSIADITRVVTNDNLDRFSVWNVARESDAQHAALMNWSGPFIDTGVKAIDDVTGLYPSEVVFLGAPKGIGKTTLARWIARRVAKHPRPREHGWSTCAKCTDKGAPCSEGHSRMPRGVVVFALEGKSTDWTDNLAAIDADLSLGDRRLGRWDHDDSARFLHALEGVRSMPVAIDDRKDLCRANLAPRVRAWRQWFAERGAELELVVLDYFQLAPWEREKGESQEEVLDAAGKHLLRIATDRHSDLLGLAWLVISAVNADGQTRGSGALEYHGDTVWRLTYPKRKDEADEPVGHERAMRLWIEKQRRGPSKLGVSFWFDGATGRFW